MTTKVKKEKHSNTTDANNSRILDQARLRPQHSGLRPNRENLVINTLLKLKGSGLSQSTLEGTSYKLGYLGKHCDLRNPEEVKLF